MIVSETQLRYSEHPVIFKQHAHDLFGVLTQPSSDTARGIGVVLLAGGAWMASPNRNRLSVRLARGLARQGFHVLRFDYHGIGESTGVLDTYWLDRPFVDDLRAAVDCLEGIGIRKIILVGSCFGARTILATADRIDGLVGAVLMSTPVRDFKMGDGRATHYARKSIWQLARRAVRHRVILSLLKPHSYGNNGRSRRIYTRTATLKAGRILRRILGRPLDNSQDAQISNLFMTQFQELSARRLPLLLLYGTQDGLYEEFEQARQGPLREVLAGSAATIDIQTIEGIVHAFPSVKVQDAVIRRTTEWINQSFA